MEKNEILKKIKQNFKQCNKIQRKIENLNTTLYILQKERDDLIEVLKEPLK